MKKTDIVSFSIGIDGKKKSKIFAPVRCSYSLEFDDKYHYLLRAVHEACGVGMDHCGPGVKLSEVASYIEEVLESYEDPDGTTIENIKTLYNICGYNMENKTKMIPNIQAIPSDMQKYCRGRMKEDDILRFFHPN